MRKNLLLISIATCLTACGGGGGGGGGGSSTVSSFTKYSDFTYGETITYSDVQTQKKTFTVTVASAGGPSSPYEVTANGITSGVGYTGSLQESYREDINDNTTELDEFHLVASDGAMVDFTGINNQGYYVLNSNMSFMYNSVENDTLVYSDPYRSGFDYQSFGFWIQNNSGTVGTFSSGFVATPSDMPQTGSATYTGKTVGVYSGIAFDAGDSPGRRYYTSSDLTMTASFTGGTISFQTNNTTLTDDMSIVITDTTNDLALSGTLTISGAGFTGNIDNNGGMQGTATGRFYGDSSEVGGTFYLDGLTNGGPDVEVYIGAFGATSAP